MSYNFNMIGEAFGFIFALLIFYFMLTTKPRMTKIFIIDFIGIFMSLITTFLHVHILRLTDFPENFNRIYFNILCIVYFVLYSVILHLIFSYIRLLSFEQRLHLKTSIIIEIIAVSITTVLYGYLIFSGKAYTYTGTSFEFNRYYYSYLLLGILDAATCFILSLANRKAIARAVFRYIMFFVPIDFFLLIIQFIYPKVEFISLTYILPFIIFYILFHSNPYNEMNGCQSRYSFETQFIHSVITHSGYLIVNVIMPKGRRLDYDNIRGHMTLLSSEKCRQIEKIDRHIRIYALSNYDYALFLPNPSPKKSEYVISKVRELLETPTKYALHNDTLVYKMIVFNNDSFIDSTPKLNSMQRYLFGKLSEDMKSECYVAQPNDYDDFIVLYEIEQLLNDIKNKMDLDDERVICYAQPIFNVETNTFRTAEALMRLKLNGKIIFPDKFISIAEQSGSIHALTCIILNKVCQTISKLQTSYDFDAITVNCSATEFSSKNLHTELLDIIRKNNIPCSKVRLELTESAMSGDYDTLLQNVQKLKDAGVQFYLDDFGTGYSNLERIIGCPFNTIKFDKSLLYKSIDDKRMDDLIVSMTQVFRKQGFVLLVEGVETDEQTQYSIDRGFTYIQGYKYAKPAPIENLANYFQSF